MEKIGSSLSARLMVAEKSISQRYRKALFEGVLQALATALLLWGVPGFSECLVLQKKTKPSWLKETKRGWWQWRGFLSHYSKSLALHPECKIEYPGDTVKWFSGGSVPEINFSKSSRWLYSVFRVKKPLFSSSQFIHSFTCHLPCTSSRQQ